MNKSEVMALLESNRNERGVVNWTKLGADTGGLDSFGIGLTRLRKLAKTVGRDHELARSLWETGNHDAKVVALLIDEPQRLTRTQAERQVEAVGPGMLSHVFSSCDATLAKAPIAFDLAREWIQSRNNLRRQCGYGLVYELSKDKRNKALTDEFFLDCLERIRRGIGAENNRVRLAMGGAIIGIGKRNKKLNQAAIRVARPISPLEYHDGDSGCEPLDILKHLTNAALKKRLDA